MFLVVVGAVVMLVWGVLLPRLPWDKSHPRYLARDPEALAKFHRLNTRTGVIAGAVLVAVGLLTLI